MWFRCFEPLCCDEPGFLFVEALSCFGGMSCLWVSSGHLTLCSRLYYSHQHVGRVLTEKWRWSFLSKWGLDLSCLAPLAVSTFTAPALLDTHPLNVFIIRNTVRALSEFFIVTASKSPDQSGNKLGASEKSKHGGQTAGDKNESCRLPSGATKKCSPYRPETVQM